MQEEVTQKTIALVIKAAKLDANILKSAMRMSWADAREKMKDAERELRFHEAVKTNTLFPNKNLSVFDIYSDPCGSLSMGYVTK